MISTPRVPDSLLALAARRRASEHDARQPLRLPSFEEVLRESRVPSHAPTTPAGRAADAAEPDEDDDFY